MQVTRGADTGRDFAFPKGVKPTLVMFTQVKEHARFAVGEDRHRRDHRAGHPLGPARHQERGAAGAGAGQAGRGRGRRRRSLDDRGRQGHRRRLVLGFHPDPGRRAGDAAERIAILPGCTRKAVVALAEERQLRVEERTFSVDEALAAKEAFITSASVFVQPVVTIDGKPVADGKPGPMATSACARSMSTSRGTRRFDIRRRISIFGPLGASSCAPRRMHAQRSVADLSFEARPNGPAPTGERNCVHPGDDGDGQCYATTAWPLPGDAGTRSRSGSSR